MRCNYMWLIKYYYSINIDNLRSNGVKVYDCVRVCEAVSSNLRSTPLPYCRLYWLYIRNKRSANTHIQSGHHHHYYHQHHHHHNIVFSQMAIPLHIYTEQPREGASQLRMHQRVMVMVLLKVRLRTHE